MEIIIAVLLSLLTGITLGYILGYRSGKYKYETNHLGIRKHNKINI